MGYYDEIIEEIKKRLENGKAQDAKLLCDRELSMPYVPAETEKQLRQLKHDIDFALSENAGRKTLSTDEVLDGLNGNEEAQMAAAASLYETNLRSIIPEIQKYLSSDPYPEAASLLIEGIAEQGIGEEFILNRDGVEYTFWGDAVVPVNESAGFQKAQKLLREWLSTKHPDMYALARKMLIHDVFLFLPLSYEEDEGEALAEDVAERISEMMDEGETWQEIKAQHH